MQRRLVKTNYEPRAERIARELERAEASTINRDAIHSLDATRSLALDRRTFRVPPIDYKAGDLLNDLLLRWNRFAVAAQLNPSTGDDATPAEIERRLRTERALNADWAEWKRDAVALAGRLLIPTSGLDRWLHKLLRAFRVSRLYPNPLRNRTEGEIVAVVHFLRACQTSDPGRVRLASRGA
jgi:hypothetical protein